MGNSSELLRQEVRLNSDDVIKRDNEVEELTNPAELEPLKILAAGRGDVCCFQVFRDLKLTDQDLIAVDELPKFRNHPAIVEKKAS